jgi:hypothetical protein
MSIVLIAPGPGKNPMQAFHKVNFLKKIMLECFLADGRRMAFKSLTVGLKDGTQIKNLTHQFNNLELSAGKRPLFPGIMVWQRRKPGTKGFCSWFFSFLLKSIFQS